MLLYDICIPNPNSFCFIFESFNKIKLKLFISFLFSSPNLIVSDAAYVEFTFSNKFKDEESLYLNNI